MYFLGLGKTLFNSSATLLTVENDQFDFEVVLTERITRDKYSGAWPEQAINYFRERYSNKQFDFISENSDVIRPATKEESFDKVFPFFDSLKAKGLDKFTNKFNSKLSFHSHHLAHAYCAISSSPFSHSLILIVDGGGSRSSEIETPTTSPENSNEFLSLYTFSKGKLCLVDKQFQSYTKSAASDGKSFSNGIGAFYESISEYIFNDKFSSGKVMGLAPFGKGKVIQPDHFVTYLDSLDWSKSYQGKSKKDWEESSNRALYQDLAATAQKTFEHYLLAYIQESQTNFPEYKNLIFSGGCALNCTFNWKLQNENIFSELYIPPSPNDAGVSLGCSYYSMLQNSQKSWSKLSHEKQNPYKGPKSSIPDLNDIESLFKKYKVSKSDSIEKDCAKLITDGNIIAWFQGRSEMGPRALGNRSILASITKENLKNYLNDKIKFREQFRPYACSVIKEDASKLFDITSDFQNPFMSYAVPIRHEHLELLKEVAHVDNTNRMQIVSENLNKRFHDLILEVKNLQGFGAVLNTSLNIMGEPIIETPQDLLRFFEQSEIKHIAIGDYLIEK